MKIKIVDEFHSGQNIIPELVQSITRLSSSYQSSLRQVDFDRVTSKVLTTKQDMSMACAGSAPPSMGYYKRFEALQRHTETRDKLIMELLVYCENIEHQFHEDCSKMAKTIEDLTLDLEDATRTRRDLQRQVDNYNHRIGQFTADNQNLKNYNPYVMVLIDGDGLHFNEDYIRSGIEGGKRAANALRGAVLKHYSELPSDTEVAAKVVCNLHGLMKAMHRDGSLDKVDDWKDFTIGFTQSKASFEFVDVGYGKERADAKIQGTAKWNLRNHNCKQVFLGISHDAGYAPFLDEILHDDAMFRRVTIIEGSPIVRELAATNLPKVSFPDIFRAEKLVCRNYQDSSSTIPLTSATPPATVSYAGITSHNTPPPPGTPPTKLSFPIKPFVHPVREAPSAVTTSTPAWDPGFRGLDEPITINRDVLDKIKNRATTNKKKLCNNHYLRGASGCFKGDDCQFEHNAKVTVEEMKAIKYLTRLNPCSNGQDCELESCIYGHHCPNTINGVCEQWMCKFSKDEHPPGTVIKHPKRRDTDYC